MLLLATCFATPYLQDYDLVFGAFGGGLAVGSSRSKSIRPERALAVCPSALFLILPLIGCRPRASDTYLTYGPVFILPLFVVALQMALAKGQSATVPLTIANRACNISHFGHGRANGAKRRLYGNALAIHDVLQICRRSSWMPGSSPRLSGLIFVDVAHGVDFLCFDVLPTFETRKEPAPCCTRIACFTAY